jgi:hypothetical protein
MSLPLAAYANGVVQSVNGELRAGPAGQPCTVVAVDQRLSPGTSVLTGTDAQVIPRFDDGQQVVLDQNTEFRIVATNAAGTVAFGAGSIGSIGSAATLATAIAAAALPAAAAPAFSNLSAAAAPGGAATGAGTAAGAAATPSATAAVPAAAAAAAIAGAAATNHDSTSTTTHH